MTSAIYNQLTFVASCTSLDHFKSIVKGGLIDVLSKPIQFTCLEDMSEWAECRIGSILGDGSGGGKVVKPRGDFFLLHAQADACIMGECAAILAEQVVLGPHVLRCHASDDLSAITRYECIRLGGSVTVDRWRFLGGETISEVNGRPKLIAWGMLGHACEYSSQTPRAIGTVRILDAVDLNGQEVKTSDTVYG